MTMEYALKLAVSMLGVERLLVVAFIAGAYCALSGSFLLWAILQ